MSVNSVNKRVFSLITLRALQNSLTRLCSN